MPISVSDIAKQVLGSLRSRHTVSAQKDEVLYYAVIDGLLAALDGKVVRSLVAVNRADVRNYATQLDTLHTAIADAIQATAVQARQPMAKARSFAFLKQVVQRIYLAWQAQANQQLKSGCTVDGWPAYLKPMA